MTFVGHLLNLMIHLKPRLCLMPSPDPSLNLTLPDTPSWPLLLQSHRNQQTTGKRIPTMTLMSPPEERERLAQGRRISGRRETIAARGVALVESARVNVRAAAKVSPPAEPFIEGLGE